MLKIILVICLVFTSFSTIYAEEPPKSTENVDESDIESFYKALEEELDVQKKRILETEALLKNHSNMPSNLIYSLYEATVSMYGVKLTLVENFYDSSCLVHSEFRKGFLAIFRKEMITQYDLLQLQVLADKYRQ